VIKIAVDHGVVAAVGHTDASYHQTHAGTSAGAQTSRPLVSWAWATRISTGDPADLVVLDSTLTPTAVTIGGIWIGWVSTAFAKRCLLRGARRHARIREISSSKGNSCDYRPA
jgi:hypothetical protein